MDIKSASAVGIPNDDDSKIVASNVNERLISAQRIAHYMPSDVLSSHKKRVAVVGGGGGGAAAAMMMSHADRCLVSGYIWMQKNAGKWKRFWAEYNDYQFTYRNDETTAKASGWITVCFVEAELNPKSASASATTANTTAAAAAASNASNGSAATASTAVNNAAASSASTSGTSTGVVASAAPPTILPPLTSSQSGGSGAGNSTGGGGGGGSTSIFDFKSRSLSISPAKSSTSPPASPTNNNSNSAAATSKQDAAYWSYLDTQEASHAFKLFSPGRVYILRAETETVRNQFVEVIRKHLTDSLAGPLWYLKTTAVQELNSVLRDQFMLQIARYNALVKSLAKPGFMEDDLPITSTRKEKSGVLAMETSHSTSHSSTDATSSAASTLSKWRDYYFVLFEGSLFYYKDSKVCDKHSIVRCTSSVVLTVCSVVRQSTTPTGFITLRYASVHLDPKRLSLGEFVFTVRDTAPYGCVSYQTSRRTLRMDCVSRKRRQYTQSVKRQIECTRHTLVSTVIVIEWREE